MAFLQHICYQPPMLCPLLSVHASQILAPSNSLADVSTAASCSLPGAAGTGHCCALPGSTVSPSPPTSAFPLFPTCDFPVMFLTVPSPVLLSCLIGRSPCNWRPKRHPLPPSSLLTGALCPSQTFSQSPQGKEEEDLLSCSVRRLQLALGLWPALMF